MAQMDLAALMKQAQALQEKFREMQESAAEKTVEAESGGGMVKVVADGSMRLRKIELDPKLLAAGDKEMLEDLVVVAVNDGLRRAQNLVANEIGNLGPLAGLQIPGLTGD